MGGIPVLNDQQMTALRRIVGTPQKFNLTTPQKSSARRLPTYSDEGSSSATSGHPFDVELITGGTTFSVRVYNSALPESQYAGTVYIGMLTYSVPVDELNIEAGEGDEFWVDLVITYDGENDPFYTLEFEIRTDPDVEEEGNVFRQTIAQGKLPEIVSVQSENIRISDRWV